MISKVKLYTLFIFYSDSISEMHIRKITLKYLTSQPVHSKYRVWWTGRVNLRLYLVHSCSQYVLASGKGWILFVDLQKREFYHYFPILHRQERDSPRVTARTVNRHVLLLKKWIVLYYHVGSNCSCPLSLVLLDNLILSSQGRTQMHS